MTIARGVAAAALVLAIVLIAVLLFRGGQTHTYDLLFQNAGQLVKDDDVQIGGRRIGSVREITLTDDNRARVRVEVKEPYAPLRDGTTAVIRLTSLSGIANRYIALTPAPNSAKELDDGATLAAGSTTTVVDLDADLQHARPRGAQGPAGRHPGLRHAIRRQGQAGRRVGRVLQPVPVDVATARQPAHAGRGHADRLHRQLLARRHRGGRAARRPRRPRRQHGHDGGRDRERERRVRSGAHAAADSRCGARTRRSSTCARRSTTSTRSSPRPSPRRRSSHRSCGTCARWSRARSPTIHDLRLAVSRNGPDNDLVDATRKLPSLQKRRHPDVQPLAAGAA